MALYRVTYSLTLEVSVTLDEETEEAAWATAETMDGGEIMARGDILGEEVEVDDVCLHKEAK